MIVKGKVAIVTGASYGIGEATARLLSQKGAKVALAARTEKKLHKLAKELPDSFVVPTDMTSPQQIKDMVKKVHNHYGRIDILVNNAGQGYDAPIEKVDIDTFHNIFDLDVVGPITAMQQVIPIMRKQGGGAIVNISSGTALMNLPNMAPYSSLKKALAGISLTARVELAPDAIVVSLVYPFITATNFEKNTIKHGLSEEDDEDTGSLPPADPPEYAAEKILEAITSGKDIVYAHDWMNRQA